MKVLENIKNNHLLFIIFILILICIAILIVRLTQSYLKAQIDDLKTTDVDITADNVDDLKFIDDDPLILDVNPTTLPENGSNLVVTSHPKVSLLSNNSTNASTYTYNVYFEISNNTFTYTNSNAPEIILTIKDPTNTNITSLTGLTYVTQGGVSGFDVTNYEGLLTIAANYSITSASSTTATVQEWTFTLTYMNYDVDQGANIGASFDNNIIFRKNTIFQVEYDNCTNPTITNTYYTNCDTKKLACKVAKEFDYENINDSKVVLHNGIVLNEEGTGANHCAVLDAEDNSYRYTGGDYEVTQTAISAGYSYVNTYSGNTTGGVIGVNCNGTNRYVGYSDSSCSTKYYYLLYDTNVTQYSTYDAALAKAITDGYLVAKNLNNYVCFGYDTSVSANETTCPEQNLYRIIGAFDDDNDGNYNVKLIKADYASTTEFGTNAQNGTSSYYSNYTSSQYTGYHGTISSVKSFRWYGSTTNNNRWDNSTFRSGVLNGYYLNTYLSNNDPKWKNMLEETTYYLGGPGKNAYQSYLSKDLFNYERTPSSVNSSSHPTSIDNYIGLIYLSDYSYASKTSIWSTSINKTYTRASGNNWMYNGIDEWLITPKHDSDGGTLKIYRTGESTSSTSGTAHTTRPVMYLNSNVEVVKGNGSKSNPYYIELIS